MNKDLWTYFEPDALGYERYEYAAPYPGTRIELTRVTRDDKRYGALLFNNGTQKVISLEEYGDLEAVAAAVVAKVQEPFEEWYNAKLRLVGIIPKLSYDHMHAVGVQAYDRRWVVANNLVKDVVSDYGLDVFEHKDMCTALAFAFCRHTYGEPHIEALPDAPQQVLLEPYTVEEVLECLDGHTILTEQAAQDMCDALIVPFAPGLVMHWHDAVEAQEKYGVHGAKYNSGVDSLELSYHICEMLHIDAPGRHYTGKGFQAQANQKALREHFKLDKEKV